MYLPTCIVLLLHSLVAVYPDLWPDALDGLLTTISALAEAIEDLIKAADTQDNQNSSQSKIPCVRESY
jgi:hypothetical protein